MQQFIRFDKLSDFSDFNCFFRLKKYIFFFSFKTILGLSLISFHGIRMCQEAIQTLQSIILIHAGWMFEVTVNQIPFHMQFKVLHTLLQYRHMPHFDSHLESNSSAGTSYKIKNVHAETQLLD